MGVCAFFTMMKAVGAMLKIFLECFLCALVGGVCTPGVGSCPFPLSGRNASGENRKWAFT